MTILQILRINLARFGLAIGIANHLVSMFTSVTRQMAEGANIVLALLHFYGFLTILTNLWTILIFAAALGLGGGALKAFRNPLMQTSALATFMLVMLFEHFILKPTAAPLVGINIYTDIINHWISPLTLLAFWLAGLPYPALKWRHLPLIMLPAILYPAYVLVRGPLLGEYPYSVIDVNLHGYPFVLAYMVQVVIGFAILCVLALLINSAAKLLSRRKTA